MTRFIRETLNFGKEIPVEKIKHLWITAIVLLISSGLAGAALPDKKGCVDHPVFPTRMPGYSIANCETKDFDAFNFETGKKDKAGVEGRRTKLTYRVEDRSKEPSGIESSATMRTPSRALGAMFSS